MRRYLSLLCVILALSLIGCAEQTKQVTDPIYTNGVYEVSISASLLHNNSVGNDWQQVFTCEGSPVGNRERWTVPLDTVKTVVIDTTIREEDKWPDIGSGSLSVDLVDGFTTSTVFTVTENKGRYRGNTAEWEIACSVTLVEKVY